MVQIYLLLVVLNLCAGLVLARSGLGRSLGPWEAWFQPFDHRLNVGLFGAATFLTGFLGLLFVLPGDQVFVGDLFPSVSALLAGTILVLEYYRRGAPPPPEPQGEEPAAPNRVEDFLVGNKIIVGVVCLVAGLLHFFSPAVVFL